MLSLDSPIRDLLPEMRDLLPAENPFPFPSVRQFQTMMIEPNTYLPAVMDDFRMAGGQIMVREFGGIADLRDLPQQVIVNCTGLGAKALFGDDELTPVKGQLTFFCRNRKSSTAPCQKTFTCFRASMAFCWGEPMRLVCGHSNPTFRPRHASSLSMRAYSEKCVLDECPLL